MAGGRIDIEVGADTSKVAGDLERGLGRAVGVAGTFGKLMGAGILAGGVVAAFGEVIKTGNDFTTELNTMQAVSSATADQMAQVSDRAKQLGNDIDLPSTSASDAAAAMTELAKGGFSVQQAMDGAKGTLQLAAAAQIDAATAATIQSQALQSFGLDASYAATAADVLANAANASSAEITDISAGLAQSGAVANQFGLTIEDTAATLGVLSNAGIAGSDAGTLLKSALLALTDQGKPAQAAIEELGLTVYNAEGQFVGMSELFGQLDTAAANMTPELYQAATATLFGSDAMRLAGVAAEQGRAGYDTMHDAIEREGAAAEVAAAKTQGLPGALAQVQNATESLSLQFYELIDGPLEGFAKSAADKITSVTPGIISAFEDVGSVLKPVAEFVGDAVSAFRSLPEPIQGAAVALTALQLSGGTDKIGGWIDDLTEKFQGFREEMQGEIDMQAALSNISDADTSNPFAALTGDAEALAGAVEENAEPLSEMAAGLATLERRSPTVRNMAEGYRQTTTRAAQFADRQRNLATQSGAVTGALRNAAASASRFGGIVGGAAVAGVRGFGAAARGAVNVLGGPWMVGLMAATTVVTTLIAASKRQSDQQDILESSAKAAATAQTELAKAFQASQGAMNDQVFGAVVQQVEAMSSEIDQLADTGPGMMDKVIAGGSALGSALSGQFGAAKESFAGLSDGVADGAGNMQARLSDLGMSSEDLANKLTGSQVQFDTFAAVLRNSGEGGQELADKLSAAREQIQQASESAVTLSPGFLDIADSIRVIADASSSADEKTSALKRALDVLAGIPVPLSQAVAEYEKTIAAVASTSADATDKTKGFGDSLLDGGKLNLATENGRNLQDTILGIKDATAEAAFAGADQNDLFAKNEITFGQLANQYGVGIEKIREFATALGLVPENITTLVAVQGADAVTQQLQSVALQFAAVPGAKEVEVKVDDQLARENLADLGFKVSQLPNGNVKVEAPNALALSALQEVIDRTIEVGAHSATPKINADTTGFRLAADQSRAELQAIDLSTADPKVGAVITDLLAGKEVSLAALNQLDTTTASPEVILAIQRALADADVIDKELDRVANRQRIAEIAVRVKSGDLDFGAGFSEAFPATPKALGGPIEGGIPGKDSVPILAMPGEHMLTTADVARLGGQEGVYRFREALARGEVRGFAGGGAIVDSLTAYVGQKFPALQMTSGYRDEAGSYHGLGQAADFSNGFGNTDAQLGLATLMASKFGSELKELIYDDPRFGREVKDGQFVDDSFYDGAGDHTNHVHIATDHVLVDPGGDDSSLDVAPLSERDQIAEAIITEGRRRGITENGIKAAVMTGLAESDLQNLPYGDRDSTGVFQQRDNGAWGTAEDRMDPTRAAGMFYDKLATFDYESMDPAAAAQRVQQSAFADGSNYRAEAEEADQIIAALGARGTATAAYSSTSSKKVTWADKDQIALDRAEVAVTQAEEARDKIYANDKKSQADRDQADLKVKAAKQKVVDLQAKKDAAAAGGKDGPAPQAPDLAKNYSEEEISAMRAQLAVDSANAKRNEVYADPESTPEDKTQADLDLAAARNSLAEQGSESGATGPSSIKGRIKEGAEQIAGILVDAAFAQIPFGLADSHWWDLEVPDFGQSIDAGKFGPSEIDGSKPVDTSDAGTGPPPMEWTLSARKDWQEQFAGFINGLRKNATLRDTGGILRHGEMGLNLSGEDEWVTTKSQRDDQFRQIANLRQANAVGQAAPVDLSSLNERIDRLADLAERPNVTYQTENIDEAIRKESQLRRQQSLTFTVR